MNPCTLHIQQRGHGPHLALLHGWGIGRAVWQNLLPMLETYFSVHCISLPGYDNTPEDDNDFNTTASALITHLPAGTHLCAWSLGAQLALAAAHQNPEHFSSLILLSTNLKFIQSADWPHAQTLSEHQRFQQRLLHQPQATLERFFTLANHGDAHARDITRELLALHSNSAMPPYRTLQKGLHWLQHNDLRDLHINTTHTPTPRLPPVLLIHGNADPVNPIGAAKWFHQKYPQSQLHHYPQTAHTPFLSRRGVFIKTLRHFCLPALPQRIRYNFNQAANQYDQGASIQRQAARHLINAITCSQTPKRILDAGCGTGYGCQQLKKRWPDSQIIGADFAPSMLHHLSTETAQGIVADIEDLPFEQSSFQAWYSNLCVQWCDLRRVLREAHRILTPGGWLALSTLGKNTFQELRQAFAHIDTEMHTLDFSVSDLLNNLAEQHGFQHPQQQRLPLRIYYPDLSTLLHAIKIIGANTRYPTHQKGLMGKTAWAKLNTAYESYRTPAGLPLSYDLILFTART